MARRWGWFGLIWLGICGVVAGQAADLCSGTVEPFDQGGQRVAFLDVAGPDLELSEQEFESDRSGRQRFVKVFDQWREVCRHDADRSGTLDWFEIATYREQVRERVMSAFDADKDRRLRGEERARANEMLGRGMLPAGDGRGGGATGSTVADAGGSASADTPAPVEPAEAGAPQRVARYGNMAASLERALQGVDVDSAIYQTALAQARQGMTMGAEHTLIMLDADGDGETTLEEARITWEEQYAGMYGWRRRSPDIDRWVRGLFEADANGDGRLTVAEMAASRDIHAQMGAAHRYRSEKQWDADNDGAISAEEREAKLSHWRQQYEQSTQKWVDQRDSNGDGKLDRSELGGIYAEETFKSQDSDGDGALTAGEMADAYMVMLSKHMDQPPRMYVAGWDDDGDGELSYEEKWRHRRKQIEAQRERVLAMRREADTDGDGSVTQEEWRAYQEAKREQAAREASEAAGARQQAPGAGGR